MSDIAWEGSRHGGNGSQTCLNGSSDGTWVISQGDVSPPMKKLVTAAAWTPLIVAGKVPSRFIGTEYTAGDRPGFVHGGYHCAFGGTSNNVIWITMQDGVIRCTDGETFTDTAITGFPVYSNGGNVRAYGDKGAADPVSSNAYHICMGVAGFKHTFDGGVTMGSPTGVPAPTHPVADATARYGIIAIDGSSSLTSGRKSRIAYCSTGNGVYLSTDGGVTASKISTGSGTGFIEACSNMVFLPNGDLIVCPTDKETGSCASNGVVRYSSGSWTAVNVGSGKAVQNIVPDPGHTNSFWAFLDSSECLRTIDGGSTFTFMQGNGSGSLPNKANLFCCTKPRFRPIVAEKYRFYGFTYALSCPKIIGAYMYFPQGLGVLRTLWADFPTANIGSVPPWNAGWPQVEEDCAGIEEVVGMSTLWLGNNLNCFGQDLAITLWEDGSRGHSASIATFPGYALSDVHGASRGTTTDWGVARRTRMNTPGAGQAAIGGSCYTTNGGVTWQNFPNQPIIGPSAIYASGHIVAGAPGVAVSLPTEYATRPQMTTDYGATAWTNCRFWDGATEFDMLSSQEQTNGLQGGDFSKNHHVGCFDPVTGNFYVHLIGGSTSSAVSWVANPDPRNMAGVYRMVPGDFPNFRRIHAGHLTPRGNYAYYDANLIADGAGNLLWSPTYLSGQPFDESNPAVVYNIAGDTVRQITDLPIMHWFSLGAPYPGDTVPCLWALARRSAALGGGYGLWYSRTLGTNGSWQGPFSTDVPGGGYIQFIDAHPTTFGLLSGAVIARGHVRGQFA